VTEAPLRDRPTARYRFYGSDARSIYIGIAVNLEQRWAFHKAVAEWWPLVDHDRTLVDWYPDRPAAEFAEVEAIAAEHPEYNILHTDKSLRAAPGPSRWAGARAEHLPARKRVILSVQETRARLRQVIDAVCSGQQVIMMRHSTPTGVLVPIEWYREAAEKMGEPTEL